MRLPTREEVERAFALDVDEGPVPLAWIVDSYEPLRLTIVEIGSRVTQASADGVYTLLKSVLVLGLNIGIRIGEARVKSGATS